MHPAPSVIFFSTFSGLGFGLLFFLGLGFPGVTGWTAFAFFTIAYLLAVGGLISSTFHLGHPERALKAFTQWRTSWLSREGWAALITLSVMGLFAAALVLLGVRIAPIGWLGALACMATVYITSMIYASINTVPRWAHWSTSAMFIAYSLAGGALLSGQVTAAIILLALTGIGQFIAWQAGDTRFAAAGSTPETATGLGHIGKVRLFEGPHSGGNYLTKEMVFVIARKHAIKLRIIALALAFAVPIVLLLLPFNHVLAALAVLSHLCGVLITRWLFFAEAEHTVSLYYGRQTA